MEIDRNVFACNWCGCTFDRRVLLGRKPHYCGAVCRQRAYESRRRGALEPARPAPAPTPRVHPLPVRYEAGLTRRRTHALRRSGPVDRTGRRTTLCGASARTSRQAFGDNPRTTGRVPCKTCHRLAERFPPSRRIDPPVELAHVANAIQSLRWAHAHADLTVLRAHVGGVLARIE